eukprot:Skav208459  [mRNA]  locus=scaffold1104:184251:185911:- [translate_table: standard]
MEGHLSPAIADCLPPLQAASASEVVVQLQWRVASAVNSEMPKVCSSMYPSHEVRRWPCNCSGSSLAPLGT